MSEHTPGGTARLGDREVARIGYGAMQIESMTEGEARASAIALLRRAAELGVDHIDTAEFYGPGTANQLLREALHPFDGIAIVSKVGAVRVEGGTPPLAVAQKPEQLRAQVDENLATLGVDRLAVVNLRRVDGGVGIVATGDQLVPMDDQLAVLIELREAGKIGGIGLSNVSAEQIASALPAGIVCVQNVDNPLHRDDEALAVCRDNGIAWVPIFPLGSAFDRMPSVGDAPDVQRIAARIGATPAQVGLAWALQRYAGTLLIPGTRSIAHLEENLAAGDVVLTDDDMAVLSALDRPESNWP
jgi:pyridoxine 4-dehydrogenase